MTLKLILFSLSPHHINTDIFNTQPLIPLIKKYLNFLVTKTKNRKMHKFVFIAICAVSSLICLTATLIEDGKKSSILRMQLQEPRCDVVAGTAECTDFCQQNGFEGGFCHESRMRCQCYQVRPPFWMPLQH
jgi:hypothetical protein